MVSRAVHAFFVKCPPSVVLKKSESGGTLLAPGRTIAALVALMQRIFVCLKHLQGNTLQARDCYLIDEVLCGLKITSMLKYSLSALTLCALSVNALAGPEGQGRIEQPATPAFQGCGTPHKNYFPDRLSQSYFLSSPLDIKAGFGSVSIQQHGTSLSSRDGNWSLSNTSTWIDGSGDGALQTRSLNRMQLSKGFDYRNVSADLSLAKASEYSEFLEKDLRFGFTLSNKKPAEFFSKRLKLWYGATLVPDIGNAGVVPFVNFSYKLSENHFVNLLGNRLEYAHTRDHAKCSVFVSYNGATWDVDSSTQADRLLVYRSWFAGVGYNHELPGGINAGVSAGYSFANKLHEYNAAGNRKLEGSALGDGFGLRLDLQIKF